MHYRVQDNYPLINDYFNSLKEQYSLTKKEVEILQLLSITGLTNEEIGKTLHIKQKTVGNYITIIQQKMDADSSRKLQAMVLRKTLPAIFFTAINPETNKRIANKYEGIKTLVI